MRRIFESLTFRVIIFVNTKPSQRQFASLPGIPSEFGSLDEARECLNGYVPKILYRDHPRGAVQRRIHPDLSRNLSAGTYIRWLRANIRKDSHFCVTS